MGSTPALISVVLTSVFKNASTTRSLSWIMRRSSSLNWEGLKEIWMFGIPSLSNVATTAVASMRPTEALASVKFYQILSIFIFFIRLIILEDFIRLISYNGACVRLGCSFLLATALATQEVRLAQRSTIFMKELTSSKSHGVLLRRNTTL